MNAPPVFDNELLLHCLSRHAVPLMIDETYLDIAVDEQADITSIKNALRFICHRQIRVTIWSNAQLAQAQKSLIQTVSTAQKDPEKTESPDEAATVKFINDTLNYALQHRASDIHFEPNITGYRVRLRIDGVLQQSPVPLLDNTAQISARLKILAGLDIAERRLPQDGQLTYDYQKQRFSLRISTLPLTQGEKIVLRVLSSQQQHHDLQRLGFSPEEQRCFVTHLQKPQGLILVTGPTGSGKTATLYNGLHFINDGSRNICSVEDPVELPLNGINQCQINAKAGFTFASALRAFLRQDPDVIMVGEIRDQETAQIAIEAAQTGHLVLSTLHTNSTTETLVRLKQMGIPAYLLASSLKLVMAQRLVRKLCPHCRTKNIDSNLISAEPNAPRITWCAAGCEHCFGGYYQRTGIFEMLTITPEIQSGLLNEMTTEQLQILACQQGMKTLFQQGLTLVENGVTSLSELLRVLDQPMPIHPIA